MDRVLSAEVIAADHFWTPPSPPHQFDFSVNDNTDDSCFPSEWEFQLFTDQEENLAAAPTSDVDEEDDDVVEISDSQAVIPPPIDSDEYQAFLKSRLDLACAAVAITRESSIGKPHDSSTSTSSGSKVSNALQGKLQPSKKGYSSCKRKDKDMPLGNPPLPTKRNKPQLKSSISWSPRELSDDYELEGSTEGNLDLTDDKRIRRMMSNRESARRSRSRKQTHLNDLETQVSQLRFENSFLSKRLTDISEKFSEAAAGNRVLKEDIETLKAKLKIAEETVKKVTGQIQVFQTISGTSTFNLQSCEGRASEASTVASVPIQDESSHDIYPQHRQTLNPSSAEATSLSPAIIPRVDSLEHLQNRIRGNISTTH